MADEPTPDQPTDTDTAPETPATDTPQPDPDELGDKGQKAIQREREARKAAEKARKELEARVKEFEDRDKSESQRLTDELAEAKANATRAGREALVARVAMTHKLDADDLDLLHGDTEEELTTRAQRIAELRAAATAATPPAPGTTRPVEQLRPGATPTQTKSEDDVVYERLFGTPTG